MREKVGKLVEMKNKITSMGRRSLNLDSREGVHLGEGSFASANPRSMPNRALSSPRRSFLHLGEPEGLLRRSCVRLGEAFLRLDEHLPLGEGFLCLGKVSPS